MAELLFPEYLNANALRAFPLKENGSRTDQSGSFVLPNSLIVAATVNATPDYTNGVFYISKVGNLAGQITATIGFAPDGSAVRDIATVQCLSTDLDITLSFAGAGQDIVVTGSITIGRPADLASVWSGLASFDPSATTLEVATIFLSIPAVEYLAVYNGNSLLGSFNGILNLVAGRNVSLSWVDANTIRLDVIDGLNTTATDECGNLVSLGPPIRSINGIPGDANNNFRLEGSDCIDIEPGGSATLNITDLCSRSCCGCNELAALEAAQAAVEQQLELLRSQLNIIQGQQSALISNLISATVS